MIAVKMDVIRFSTARSSSVMRSREVTNGLGGDDARWSLAVRSRRLPRERGEPLPEQAGRESEAGALELPPTVEHEAQEAHHLVQAHARLEAIALPCRVATRVHVLLEEPGAHPLGGLLSVPRRRPPCLARGQPQVGEELAEVERRFGLTDGVEVNEPALVTGEDQLRGAEVPVAEARRPWVRRGCTCGDRVEPLLEPGSEVGGDPYEDGERLLQLGELVFGTACGSDSDARGVKTRRNPRGPVGRILQCRRPVCFGRVLQVFPQELGDPWHAGDGFQQNEPQRLDESERSRNGKRPGLPPKDRLEHRNRRDERWQIAPTAHGGGERTQAGLEIRPGRPCALKQTGSHERWRYEPPYVVAHLDRVPHGATLAGHVHRLPALAAPDDVSVPAVLEEAGLQVPSHQALVELIVHTWQLCAVHAAAPLI